MIESTEEKRSHSMLEQTNASTVQNSSMRMKMINDKFKL